MVFDIIMWVLIAIIGLFFVFGVYTFFSMLFGENEQETDKNDEKRA